MLEQKNISNQFDYIVLCALERGLERPRPSVARISND